MNLKDVIAQKDKETLEELKNRLIEHRGGTQWDVDNPIEDWLLKTLHSRDKALLEAVVDIVEGMRPESLLCESTECKISIYPNCRHKIGGNDMITEIQAKLKETSCEYLPNCAYCGGVRFLEDYNHELGEATVKELHEKDCDMVVEWQKDL